MLKVMGENNPTNFDPENRRISFSHNFDIAVQTRPPPPPPPKKAGSTRLLCRRKFCKFIDENVCLQTGEDVSFRKKNTINENVSLAADIFTAILLLLVSSDIYLKRLKRKICGERKERTAVKHAT
jgi:hypothetical protein